MWVSARQFATPPVVVQHPSLRAPQSVAAADLNDDGALDLAAPLFGQASVSILLGRGDGAFDHQSPDIAVGESPRDTGLDAGEHAALAATCLAILNLDESLTRE